MAKRAFRYLTGEHATIAHELRHQGRTVREICERLSISHGTVCAMLRGTWRPRRLTAAGRDAAALRQVAPVEFRKGTAARCQACGLVTVLRPCPACAARAERGRRQQQPAGAP